MISYIPEDKHFGTDAKGKFLKKEYYDQVLSRFSNGEEAKQYFDEDEQAGKLYLLSSLHTGSGVVSA